MNGALGYEASTIHNRLTRSESLFRLATVTDSQNRSAWRGLGFTLSSQQRDDEAWDAWIRAGGMGSEFIQWGHQAFQRRQYELAHDWYDKATLLEPAWSDPLYYKALAFKAQGQWEDVLLAYEQARQLSDFHTVPISDFYFNQGLFYQQNPARPDISLAVEMYDQALLADDFSSSELKAEAFYKRGEVYGWQGRDPRESITDFQQALSLNSRHHWARLRLGNAIYWTSKDVDAAVSEIEAAIKVWPRDSIYRKWPYLFLGEIYRDAGENASAVAAYEEALRHDPADEEVREILALLKE
jgi:tetratricopeptide (TPR) repeat protein